MGTGFVRWLTVVVLLVGACTSDGPTSTQEPSSSSDDWSSTTGSDDNATATSASDDGVEALSKDDYVAQANAICVATNAVVDAAVGEFFETTLPNLQGPAAFAEAWNMLFDEVVTPAVDQQMVELRALGAPREDADLLAGLYDDLDQALQEYNAILDDAAAGDFGAIEAISTGDAENVFDNVNQRARDYGLSACGADDSEPTTDDSTGVAEAEDAILALGDSIFESNAGTGESIPDVIGEVLGRPVLNAAVGGAHFSSADPAAAQEGLDIRRQYVEGDWAWVIMDGGGNDYNDDCGCGACEPVLDVLVSVDGQSGEIPDFARSLLQDGTQVMFVGYYEVPPDAEFGFDRCTDEVIEHGTRLQAMAAAIDGIWFVSAGDVVSADNRLAYSQDRVHPSPAGSRLVGEHVAAAIETAEGNEG